MESDGGEDLYRRILDAVHEAVYLLDREGRVTYWNPGAERVTGYRSEEMLGSRCMDGLLMRLEPGGGGLCDALCPALQCMEGKVPLEAELYLRHKQGHRVPILARATPLTRDGEVTGAVEVLEDNGRVEAARRRVEELEKLALLDQLTGLGNRRHAEMHIRARLDELERYGWSFSLLFFDIDRFKWINDTHGHGVGDRVLRMVARSTEGGVRSSDVVSRWGGEEFVALLQNVEETEVRAISGKLRALVEASSLTAGGGSVSVTVSMGATAAVVGDTVQTLVDRADGLMYESKRAGRNRVTFG